VSLGLVANVGEIDRGRPTLAWVHEQWLASRQSLDVFQASRPLPLRRCVIALEGPRFGERLADHYLLYIAKLHNVVDLVCGWMVIALPFLPSNCSHM